MDPKTTIAVLSVLLVIAIFSAAFAWRMAVLMWLDLREQAETSARLGEQAEFWQRRHDQVTSEWNTVRADLAQREQDLVFAQREREIDAMDAIDERNVAETKLKNAQQEIAKLKDIIANGPDCLLAKLTPGIVDIVEVVIDEREGQK